MKTRYREICERLGFNAEMQFVKIHPGGAIGFTAGKPDEIQDLARAVQREGMRMSRGLRRALERY